MGTNYYARILPSKKRKDEIKKAIDDNDFNNIKRSIGKTYGSPCMDYDDTTTYCGGEIHLGKRSAGWKFLWNPNWYKIPKGHMEKGETLKETAIRETAEETKRVAEIIDEDSPVVEKYTTPIQ